MPQLIAYAETVGYAGYRGLATAGFSLAVWGVVTGNPFMNSGVTSLTALMAKSDLKGDSYVSEHGEEEYVRLVAAYSLWVGICSIGLAILGLGQLTGLVPKPVRSGFKWGCALGVLVSAIPNGLFAGGNKELKSLVSDSALGDALNPLKANFPGGVNVASVFYALSHPNLWALAPTLLFVLGTAFVMQSKSFLPKGCPPGTEVVLLTAAATLYSMKFSYDAATVGEIPALNEDAGITVPGLGLRIPIEFLDIKQLVKDDVPLMVERCFNGSWILLTVTACVFSSVNFLSIVGIASIFETENGIPWSARRELCSQGFACVGAAAVGSAPVSGSLSRSLVSRMTGTSSQLACIVTALCWIYLQPFMSIMTPCPKAALSAVIVSAVLKGIVQPKDMMSLKGLDSLVGWFSGIMTATTSPTNGFLAGLILYVVLSVLRTPEKEKGE